LSTASNRNSCNAIESIQEGRRAVAGKKIDGFVLDVLV
jgi:hypothetical protein